MIKKSQGMANFFQMLELEFDVQVSCIDPFCG